MRAANTAAAETAAGTVSFQRMARLIELRMGATWWHDPERWPTADGFAPYHVVWAQWEIVVAAMAWDRLNLVRVQMLPHLERLQQQVLLDRDHLEAFGG